MTGALDSPQKRGQPPFHLRETSPETQALYERQRRELARLYRELCEAEREREKKK